MAPVIEALEREDRVSSMLCATGQHADMLDQALSAFGLSPDFNLNVMKENQSLSRLTARILDGMTSVLTREKPDLVLVHGDTATTFAASLAAYYEKLPVAHVEAGLRSGDMDSPWPEEANRRMVGLLAAHHFAPTSNAHKNLMSEGVPDDKITVTGNTVIDAVFSALERLNKNPALRLPVLRNLMDVDLSKRIVLVTAHRRESLGTGLRHICQAVAKLAQAFPDVQFVFPVHTNPKVSEPVRVALSGYRNIATIPALDYLTFVYLLSRSTLVMTDSGGIQEEAPSLGVPVLVMRDKTERVEAIASGTAILTGARPDVIFDNAAKLLTDKQVYMSMSRAENPFGDGRASQRIIQHLTKDLPCPAQNESRSLDWAM